MEVKEPQYNNGFVDSIFLKYLKIEDPDNWIFREDGKDMELKKIYMNHCVNDRSMKLLTKKNQKAFFKEIKELTGCDLSFLIRKKKEFNFPEFEIIGERDVQEEQWLEYKEMSNEC
jgi:hypothetical protein